MKGRQDTPYAATIDAWRRTQEESLRAPDGWLAVTALIWLEQGETPLPEPYARHGSVRRTGDTVAWLPRGGSPRTLRPDTEPPADPVDIGSAQFQVLRRGKRVGVRIRDADAPARRTFPGRIWYVADPRWRIQARFHPYPKGRTLRITDVLGDTKEVPCPGYATFTAGGRACRLEAWGTPTGLFFVFADATTGKGTYPGGRFLEADSPVDGTVVLDFNRAENPPCAFTEHATCPLPPRANRLRIAIPAGERASASHR